MKIKDIIIDERTFELLEKIHNSNDDSINNFIQTCSVNSSDFVEFLKSKYALSENEEIDEILNEIQINKSTSKSLTYEIQKSTDSKEILPIDSIQDINNISFEELLNVDVHLGHLASKWNSEMAPYIYMEQFGIHIIDLHKAALKIIEAAIALNHIAESGREILFVGTKKQAKRIIEDKVGGINMPYITERWPGGMLTNFSTIKKAIEQMTSINKMMKAPEWGSLSKQEQQQVTRQYHKLKKIFSSISNLNRLPAALFVIDATEARIAVREAKRLGIPVFAMVDAKSNPHDIDYAIPANNDAGKSIESIIDIVTEAIAEGIIEREKVVRFITDSETISIIAKEKKHDRNINIKIKRKEDGNLDTLSLDD